MRKVVFIFFAVFTFISSGSGQDINNTMLWRISSKAGGKPSYLFGTMHLAQEKFLHFTDSVYKAVAGTDMFFGELDYDNIFTGLGDSSTAAFFESKQAFLDSAFKTPEWKAMVERMNRKYGTALNPDSLEQFVELSTKITSKIYEPEPGLKMMDLMLSDYAKSLGKKTGGLETFMLQIDMMYKIIGARLQDTALNFDDEKMLLENFKRYYGNQRLDSVNHYLQHIHPGYRDIVFTQRNKTMADSIEKYSNKTTAFFAIGCGHLAGDDGVIELLRKKGFVVSPVHSDNRISLLLLNELKDKRKESKVPDAPKEMSESEMKTLLKRLDDMKIPGDETKVEVTDVKITQLPDVSPSPPPPPVKKKKTAAKKRN
jgi:uncharacterized protein YbaP (TraB family)